MQLRRGLRVSHQLWATGEIIHYGVFSSIYNTAWHRVYLQYMTTEGMNGNRGTRKRLLFTYPR